MSEQSNQLQRSSPQVIERLRQKRIQTLVGAYQLYALEDPNIANGTTLDQSSVAQVVEEYLADRDRFVARNCIDGRIQRHKVAGLMTASIARFRPIHLKVPDSGEFLLNEDNENLAVLHGIALCAEGSPPESLAELVNRPVFKTWRADFVYLLRRHADTAHGFTMIYETLCMSFFPEALEGHC